MTIINEIEIDDINYRVNDIKLAIFNNDPIEEKLHVIIVVSNPCLYARRYSLLKEFVKRFEEEEPNVNLYIVELAYGKQKFVITDEKNKNHLQLRTETPLWHKENMINLGVKYLLPETWKAFAWIDADIEFDSSSWALDTLKILNGSKDIVQLFSYAVNMDREQHAINIFPSFSYNYYKLNTYFAGKEINYPHPGFAWAITRKAYERIGGLYETSILGSGDNYMAFSIINKMDIIIIKLFKNKFNQNYINNILQFQEKAKNLRLGYVPGIIKHYFHGTRENRKYVERSSILINHDFSPEKHITKDDKGIIIPTEHFSQEFKDDIMNYFRERKEDE